MGGGNGNVAVLSAYGACYPSGSILVLDFRVAQVSRSVSSYRRFTQSSLSLKFPKHRPVDTSIVAPLLNQLRTRHIHAVPRIRLQVSYMSARRAMPTYGGELCDLESGVVWRLIRHVNDNLLLVYVYTLALPGPQARRT